LPKSQSGASTPRPSPSPLQFEQFEYSPSNSFVSGTGTSPGYPNTQFGKQHVRIDSRSALLTPPGGVPMQYANTAYPPPPGPPYYPPMQYSGYYGWYNRYWNSAWNMYFFLVAGIMFAVGHHIFYSGLHGQDAENQLRMLRYGATLSFLCKASLAAAVILAFRQRVWMTVRRKTLSVDAVDSLFAAAEDMTAVFNFEVFKQAKVAMLLAVYVWATPLVVILTSETLAVELMSKREETICPAVRSLNFTHEETNDWRVGQKLENLYELSVCYWNTTSSDTTDPNWFDYFTGTSQQFEQVATLSAYLQKPVERTGAAQEICGNGWNCTFTIKFTGPGYKCTELASGVGSTPKDLGSAKVPFSMDLLAPTGNFTYFSLAYRGEYADIQTDSGDAGIPNFPPPFPPNLGALRTEPIIWIGYAAVDDPAKPQPGNNSDPAWKTAYTPKIFGCEHYETEYEVLFNYTGLKQHTSVKNRRFIAPIINTTFVPDQLSQDGTRDNTTAVPEENYIFPKDVRRYRRTSAYHSIGSQLRHFVNGTINEPGKIVKTRAIQTRLIDVHNYLGVVDLMEAVQSFYEDILLSMFSNPTFLAVVWASDPGQVTGTLKGGENTSYPCVRERTDNRFRYHFPELWIVYSISIGLAVLAVVFGVMAIQEEGGVRNTRFSSIVAATRGPGLEKVPWNAEVHRRFRVGYGLVPRGLGVDPSDSTYGFGIEGDVRQEAEGRRQPTFRRWERLSG
jgi:hypothetical protein